MEQLKKTYYERYINFVVDAYTPVLKQAKAGHCMKITGLAMRELLILLPLLKSKNESLSMFILSETEKGVEYIHASKLIEMRNDPEKALLVLVPSNSRTSAEDSYGDATFQNLNVADLQYPFFESLLRDIPSDKESQWSQIKELLKAEVKPSLQAVINYLLYLDLNHYDNKSWGNGLFVFGILPDEQLLQDGNINRRRFMLNLYKVSTPLSDFSKSASERIAAIPLQKDTIQKNLVSYLNTGTEINDSQTLFQDILENHPEYNYNVLPLADGGKDSDKVKVVCELAKGNNPNTELIQSKDGQYVLSIPDRDGAKCKVSFTVVAEPSPQDDPDICFFEISLVNIEDFSEIAVLKKAKVGTNRRAKRRLSVNIANNQFEDGEYMIRVRVLDENGIAREMNMEFKEDSVQQDWLEACQKNPDLIMDAYRLNNRVAYCNESAVFSIYNNQEDTGISTNTSEKGTKINTVTQAIIQYRSSRFKEKKMELKEFLLQPNAWQEGSLGNTYQFDFGPSFVFQLQVAKKLIQLETTFLNNSSVLGRVDALLSGNPTDTMLMNPNDTADQKPVFVKADSLDVPDELLAAHKDLFEKIKESAADGKGLTCTFDLPTNIELVKKYIQNYDLWIRGLLEQDLDESKISTLQNLETVNLDVELPNGSKTRVKLISPLHPLRLAWMVNLYELYLDWESKTIENPKYKNDWYRKLDRLFLNGLPMEIAPAVLCSGNIEEAYQYIGELTFGWGIYSKPGEVLDDEYSTSFRQLKSYVATLLNISVEKRIESDVDISLVCRHIFNYALSHPYTDKLVINLFNAGDASVFADALIQLEKWNIGRELSYEIRLFSENSMLQSGEALKRLLDPEAKISDEAEVFSQASSNRLFPKLRFSMNTVSEYISSPKKYQAHLTFLISPFSVHTELVRQDELSRSFYLNGTICKSIVMSKEEGKSFVWNRYYSNKTLPNPVNDFADIEISLFARLQNTVAHLLSSTLEESVPATTLRLKDVDKMLLKFVHESSDWVITFDKNMGPEFYDLPCENDNDVPYLLDYIPRNEASGISSFLTTLPTSEIEYLMHPVFKEFEVDFTQMKNFKEILEDVRAVSSSLIMQASQTPNKGFEIIGTTLTKRFLEKKGIMNESFIIPIDLHKDLFGDDEEKSRADNLVVKINSEKKEILIIVVEIKCRNSIYQEDELHNKILSQIGNTVEVLRSHFEMALDGVDRLDRELKTLELKTLLEFYIKRSVRFGQLSPELAHNYLEFLSKLVYGYTIRFKQLGIIYNFLQKDRQKKCFVGDAVIYTMGGSVIKEILDPESSLETVVLAAKDDEDFVNFFEPTKITKIEDEDEEDNLSPLINPDSCAEGYTHPATKQDENQSQPTEPEKPVTGKEDKSETPNPTTKPQEDLASVSFPSTEEPKPVTPVIVHPQEDEVKTDYKGPDYDVIIGSNGDSPQYGILGKVPSNGRRVAFDLDECNTISLFGVQGAGKSYTIGSVIEMVVKQFPNINKLPAPMAGVIFHYSDSMDYAPEFTSIVYPNDAEGQLAKLKSEYGAEAGSVKDVVLLTPESQVNRRQAEYPDIEVHPIGFDSSELQLKDWMFLLGAIGNDATYIKELKQIMKNCRNNMSLANIKAGLDCDMYFTNAQRTLAQQKLRFASDYITDGNHLSQYLRPGRLVIVDLRDEYIEKEEALGLFVVMLDIFSNVKVVNGKTFNKFIVFDEAHKYMNNKDLVESITGAIREMRHKGVSVMIASQDPMSLPTEIIELSSVVVMHKFSSPNWVKHVQKAITALQTLTSQEMAALGSGEAYVWANKASDRAFTMRPVKISIRPRVTKHGGDTINAVN